MPYKDREQQRTYQRQWRADRRTAWLEENGPCEDCSSWDQLEVDHVDQAAKVTHKVWSWSAERRKEELAKCVVRCKSCHAERTRKQLAKSVCAHGHDTSVAGRDSSGRCIECRREWDRRARREGRKKLHYAGWGNGNPRAFGTLRCAFESCSRSGKEEIMKETWSQRQRRYLRRNRKGAQDFHWGYGWTWKAIAVAIVVVVLVLYLRGMK